MQNKTRKQRKLNISADLKTKFSNNQRFFLLRKSVRFSKKSQIEDMFQYTFAIFSIISLFLYLSYRYSDRTLIVREKINLQVSSQESKELLLNYLRISLTINDQSLSIAYAINAYSITNDENLLKEINKITNEFFTRSFLEKDINSWSLEIEYADKSLTIESEKAKIHTLRKKMNEIIVPTYYPNQYIKIKLFQTQLEEYTTGFS